MDSSLDRSIHFAVEQWNEEKIKQQIELIKHASEVAQDRMDYSMAHDESILRAIEVVEEFLRKKHRICYGGQAINAHLPDSHKIYDPTYTIPDYDFFTPRQEEDIQDLVNDLKKAGFMEISAKEGMHEGTIKIYVEYVPVADITVMDTRLYRILSKREFRKEGISYLDVNTLRMLMYLELSRPRGEVSRWPKVYERLMLLNHYVSVNSCSKENAKPFHDVLTMQQTEFTLDFILKNKRIFAGGDLVEFYRQVAKRGSRRLDWILRSKKPILFYSPDADQDAKILQNEFNFMVKQNHIQRQLPGRPKQILVRSHESKNGDMVPKIKILSYGKEGLVYIIQQSACHSYINLPMKYPSPSMMRIASMDTLINLYFSMSLIQSIYFDIRSLECLANQIIQLSIHSRKHMDQFKLPFVSILCSGHQTSFPSLIRAKVKRLMTKRKQVEKLMKDEKLSMKKVRAKTVQSKSQSKTVKNRKRSGR
jgi:hypothetical protein